ncbi:MAG TPA: FAD-dependent oxidoreductase [Rudaea sp.]|nr:FAD-dependent oxidoreductase [Rudaea sp.]
MRAGSGNTESLWQATASLPEYALLDEDANADVVVVGAGIAGLSSAYSLARSGKRVIVLDARGVGGGETARTTAHLASGLDDRYYELERMHGKDGARLAAESHAAAIAHIEHVVRNEGIACDFERVPGYLIPGAGSDTGELEREREAAARAGLDVAGVEPADVLGRRFDGALRFAAQAQFHPLRYLAGLAEACTRLGVRIHGHSAVREVAGGKDAHVHTREGRRVSAGAVVVATNSPMNDRVAIHTKQSAYRTFVVALTLEEPVAPCLVWDTEDPYHYVRIWHDAASGATWLIVGGEDHKTGQPDDETGAFARLTHWTRERLGVAGEVRYAWSGQVQEPHDGLAFIGRNPSDDDNVYVITGDSGNGMTHGTLAALVVTDLIDGKPNAWAELYSPSRKEFHGFQEFVRENANVAAQYADLVTAGALDDVEEVARGSGAVVRRGAHKLAAYRDFDGALHLHSAICTHLGCVVRWNAVEQSWDCPCHGSRFDPLDGGVINAPARAPLAAAPDNGRE